MKAPVFGSRWLSLPMALLLSFAVAGQSMAAGWSAPIRLASGGAWAAGLVGLRNSTAIAVYEVCMDIGDGMCVDKAFLKRSTDGGMTWSRRIAVSRGYADMAAVAGRGTKVDLVWRGGNGELRYARSSNSGASFGSSRVLSTDQSTREPSVARGRDGLVAVAWGGWPDWTDVISVRVSSDGGRTFGAVHSWASSDTYVSAVAVGAGVVYVAYFGRTRALLVRRSHDSGATWSGAVTISGRAEGYWPPTLAAAGSDAYIAYQTLEDNDRGQIRYRRTSDKGVAWSPSSRLSPNSWSSAVPRMSLTGGVLRAVFFSDAGLFYVESSDGISWTPPQRVSRDGNGFVAFAGRIIVLYTSGSVETPYVRTRAR